ncbi:hypothetical protein FIV00_15055 [Labrenzia sp. THAF82]|uniref:hypothetical protein n=1 Tax=Labrenzia sp. THAF82 TaxID=2587861 RepID=UPI001268B2F4|nr:hypothetical protein [Labrenzia sp. THAF82]QFT31809.1 hypothetical protein FIV00_15055 [Labrenzia sp. THAF82]
MPWLKMLTPMAGKNFSLSIGDKTDRFNAKEAKRLVEAGLAEKTTKRDDSLVAVKEQLKKATAERDALKKTVGSLQAEIHALKLKSVPTGNEQAVQSAAPETRS